MNKKGIIVSLVCIVAIIGIIVFIILNNNSNNSSNDKNISDNYILVLSGGAGEITFDTYVYKNDNNKKKYKYILTTSMTKSWGSTEWDTKVDKEGYCNSIEEIIEIAKGHGCSYAQYKGKTITSFDELIREFSD